MAGTRVQQLREAAQLSRAELGDVIGEEESAIERYEAGEPLPPGVAHKLAAMFAVSVPYLTGEE
jgi:transcriptional regulator with XRE-family HTH domain